FLPGWAVGLPMFGSYVSSISFLANPGKSFAGDWNAFVFTLATPVAAVVAVRWFVPFYRRAGEVSAYEHLGRRFGPWARTYAVVCFLLTQVARTGTVVYLLALAASPLTGWGVPAVIVLVGTLMVVASFFGGIQAAVWVGAVQSVVLVAGPVACAVVLLGLVPGGVAGVVETAQEAGKLGLGSLAPSLAQPTFWVVLVYGLTINLGNFGIDQSYVQRYITTPTLAQARRSVWITAALYVPTAALFFFIGTALWALHGARPELFPAALDAAAKPDAVFPAFIAGQLPVGLAGLVVASIFAASMDSSLSSMATLTLCDVYKRYVRPHAGERESIAVLRGATLGWGVVATGAALLMTRAKNVLDVWWELAGVFSGGMLGLFLLGLIARRARNATAVTAVTVGVLVILWMTLSPKAAMWPASLDALRSPFHNLMISVVGTLTVLLVGLLVSRWEPRERRGSDLQGVGHRPQHNPERAVNEGRRAASPRAEPRQGADATR
ncbi:MAG: Predicted sialic acid transporter, partial [uncultured Phycisphaerae bacterium]